VLVSTVHAGVRHSIRGLLHERKKSTAPGGGQEPSPLIDAGSKGHTCARNGLSTARNRYFLVWVAISGLIAFVPLLLATLRKRWAWVKSSDELIGALLVTAMPALPLALALAAGAVEERGR
jgi:hypothetical protein